MISNFSFGNGDNIFFTSDLHFNHKKIIEYCGRPFSSVEEMNETIITHWNNTVKKDSLVFILGDMAFCGTTLYQEFLSRLKGVKILIKGNHDQRSLKSSIIPYFDLITNMLHIYIEGQSIYLSHFPFLCFNDWNLFGHVHTSKYKNTGFDFERMKYALPTQYDVGVDFNDFTPISWNTIKERINYQIENNVNYLNWL